MPEDRFTSNVLRCLGRPSEKAKNGRMPTGKWTAEEIRSAYLSIYPPNLLQMASGFIPEVHKFEKALLELIRHGFVEKELTWFTDKPLKKETAIYSVTKAGMALVLSTKPGFSRKK